MEKNIVLTAINDYDLYTQRQKKILSTLVSVSVDGVAHISVPSISKVTGLAQNSTYVILRTLEEEGCIVRERNKGQKSNAYKLNETKLNQLVRIHHQKQATMNEVKKTQ